MTAMELLNIIPTSLATAAVALTVSHSSAFTYLRNRLEGKLDCSFCVSHWAAAAIAAFATDGLGAFILTWLASVAGAAIVIRLVLGPYGSTPEQQ
jgi:hypothetical protein